MITKLQDRQFGRLVLGLALSLALVAPTAASASECRNDQIVSYSISPGERIESLEGFFYDVSEDTDPNSLRVEVNGDSQPVVHAETEEGYKAIVLLVEDYEGSVYIDMYADSTDDNACNNPISTSVVAGPTDMYNEYGVRVGGANPTADYQSSTQQSGGESVGSSNQEGHATVDGSGTESEVAVVEQDQTTQAPDGESDADSEETERADGASSELASGTTTATNTDVVADSESSAGNQAASMWGGVTQFFSPESCATFGAMWPWYAWLGVIWVYLVVLWLVVTYFVEPVIGRSDYTSRLGWTMGIGTLLSVLFWYLANPCFTHAWVPIVLVVLGVLLYWLYSEEDDATDIVIETKDES